MVRYHNHNTGDTVDMPAPSRRLDRLPNWERLDPDEPKRPAPISDKDPALKTLRLADLRAMAEEAGLSTEGSKAELIARLTEPATGGRELPSSPGGPDDSEE